MKDLFSVSRHIRFYGLIAFFLCFNSLPAMAQDFLFGGPNSQNEDQAAPKIINQYDPKYSRKPVVSEQEKNRLISSAKFKMDFIRPEGIPANVAVLRLSSGVAVDGCAAITSPAIEKQIKGRNLWYTIGTQSIEISPPADMRPAGCAGNRLFPASDLPLDRSEIIERGITALALQNAYGEIDMFDIVMNQNSLRLVPQAQSLSFHTDSNNKPITYWFLPENVIILSAAFVGPIENVEDKINRLAAAKRLVPAAKLIEGFENPAPPLQNETSFYFIDGEQSLDVAMADHPDGFKIGTITATEIFYGPNGPYEALKDVDVYARRPRSNDGTY